ncbi:cupin domain-containing protein [Dyadobacter sp. MSC1_007]|jgi:quercetin dioxygenase-like cupin family protein|uniref:cupin domain-containing protein n=1 Tax=Dyadobacter sp. MSC1_007 TaxID=2909264 RepID=UPI002030E2C3|nr:cupin domain-containing protein [Dyadobacter sp. MSC1_007]
MKALKSVFLLALVFSSLTVLSQTKVTHFELAKLPSKQLNNKVSRGLFSGKNATIGYFTFAKGAIVPLHHHDNEQYTMILKGSVKVTVQGQVYIVQAGEGIFIPSNIPHMFESLEDGTIDVDFFAPKRLDWINGTDNYFNKPIK